MTAPINDKSPLPNVQVFDLDDVFAAHVRVIRQFYGSVTSMKKAGCDSSFLDECKTFKQTDLE